MVNKSNDGGLVLNQSQRDPDDDSQRGGDQPGAGMSKRQLSTYHDKRSEVESGKGNMLATLDQRISSRN